MNDLGTHEHTEAVHQEFRPLPGTSRSL